MKEFKRVKTAVIGCGMISGTYLDKLVRKLNVIEIVGCSDLIEEKSRAKAGEFNIRQMTNEEILADKSIEIVVNLTYPTQHYAVAKQVLEAGKHCYTEKMLVTDYAQACELRDIAAKNSVYCCGAPDTFLGAGFQTARQVFDSGIIGKPVAASIALARSYQWDRFYTGPDKRFMYGKNGGILYDMGGYYLTFLTNLLGGIDSACGYEHIHNGERTYANPNGTQYGEELIVESQNVGAASFRFRNGALATLMFTSESGGFHNSIMVYGTEGCLDLGDPNEFGSVPKITTKFSSNMPLALTHAFTEGCWRGIGVAEMAYAIQAGRKPRTEMQMPMHVMEAILGVVASSADGRAHRLTTPFERPQPLSAGYSEYPEMSLMV